MILTENLFDGGNGWLAYILGPGEALHGAGSFEHHQLAMTASLLKRFRRSSRALPRSIGWRPPARSTKAVRLVQMPYGAGGGMVAINVEYQGDMHCLAVHGPSGTTLVTDAPADNFGKAQSFSPTDLVATALGTCILTVMGMKARSIGVDMTGATASIEKDMAVAPRRIARLAATELQGQYRLQGQHTYLLPLVLAFGPGF